MASSFHFLLNYPYITPILPYNKGVLGPPVFFFDAFLGPGPAPPSADWRHLASQPMRCIVWVAVKELKLLYYPLIMENQMEKKMENEMETGGI